MKYFLLLSLVGCAQPYTTTDLASYAAEQNLCIVESDAAPAMVACVTANRAAWCVKFPSAQNCDGGAK